MNNPLIIENTITHEKIFKSLPINEEVLFDGGVIRIGVSLPMQIVNLEK